MVKLGKYILVFVLVILLILIRAFQDNLFYDPFIQYFKNGYLYQDFPKYDMLKLYLNLIMRYALNGVISIAIIYLLFKKEFLRFGVLFYFLAGLILFVGLAAILNMELEDYKPFFYVRRFIIHPIFILLLIPAFYYQKRN